MQKMFDFICVPSLISRGRRVGYTPIRQYQIELKRNLNNDGMKNLTYKKNPIQLLRQIYILVKRTSKYFRLSYIFGALRD